MKKLLIVTILGVLALPSVSEAARKIDPPREEEIREFCEGKPAPPKKGIQWNGDSADSAVMFFRAGDYELDFKKGLWLWLYHDGSFYVNLSKRTGVSFGSDGDDFIDGRLIGGCSREQLSEILKKNDILDKAREKVPEDILLREEAEQVKKEEFDPATAPLDAVQPPKL